MRRREVWQELRAAMRDPQRIGDVPVYKSELFGSRASPATESLLDPVRDFRPRVDLEALAGLPESSFGWQYQAFLKREGLHPFVMSDRPSPEMIARNAFVVRYGIIHDMVHVLTGFDASWPGEAGVWAFVGGQDYSRGFRIAATVALLATPFRTPLRLAEAWRNWRRGWHMGRRATKLIGVRLEDQFERDLGELRRDLGLPEDPEHVGGPPPSPAKCLETPTRESPRS